MKYIISIFIIIFVTCFIFGLLTIKKLSAQEVTTDAVRQWTSLTIYEDHLINSMEYTLHYEWDEVATGSVRMTATVK